MPSKKEREMLLKNEEFYKAMMEERNEEETVTLQPVDTLQPDDSTIEDFETQQTAFNIEEIIERVTMLEKRVAMLEMSKGSNFNPMDESNLKFPGTRGTVAKPREVKFPRQSGNGNFYTPYK